MAGLGLLLTVGGGIAAFVGVVAILIVAFKESTGQGLCNFFLGPYMLYYVVTGGKLVKRASCYKLEALLLWFSVVYLRPWGRLVCKRRLFSLCGKYGIGKCSSFR